MIATLQQLKKGEQALVLTIQGGHNIRQRLYQSGVHPGDSVRVVRTGFFGGPVLIKVHGIEVAIGKGMAQKVEVEVTEP